MIRVQSFSDRLGFGLKFYSLTLSTQEIENLYSRDSDRSSKSTASQQILIFVSRPIAVVLPAHVSS